MSRSAAGARIRIPIKFIDGRCEFAFGGIVPAKEGAEAELLIDRNEISDEQFLKSIDHRGCYRVLEEGQSLLVGLTIKEENYPPDALKEHLIWLDASGWKTRMGPVALEAAVAYCRINAFVEVKLASLQKKQRQLFPEPSGGLWLITEGFKAKGLFSSTIQLHPHISTKPVASLNHALTILSEKYETWRISHTGNIYTRVFYREKSGKWYPLDLLRKEALHKNETEIAKETWQLFLARMSAPQKTPRKG